MKKQKRFTNEESFIVWKNKNAQFIESVEASQLPFMYFESCPSYGIRVFTKEMDFLCSFENVPKHIAIRKIDGEIVIDFFEYET